MTGSEIKLFNKVLNFVKEKHKGQVRAGGVPVWHHLARVSSLLYFLLNNNKEGTPSDRFNIALAGLGHDILEDTKATIEEVGSRLGAQSSFIIKGMTNDWGDDNTKPYIKKVINSEESVRLVKLADLYDNMTHVAYCFPLLGLKWATSYFLPIVVPMKEAVIKTRFKKYKKTAGQLILLVNSAATLLLKEFQFYKKTAK